MPRHGLIFILYNLYMSLNNNTALENYLVDRPESESSQQSDRLSHTSAKETKEEREVKRTAASKL